MVDLITAQPDSDDILVDGDGVASYEFNTYNEEVTDAINNYVAKNKVANVAPTVNDDASQGFNYFSRWIDTTGPIHYECADPSVGAADWNQVFP